MWTNGGNALSSVASLMPSRYSNTVALHLPRVDAGQLFVSGNVNAVMFINDSLVSGRAEYSLDKSLAINSCLIATPIDYLQKQSAKDFFRYVSNGYGTGILAYV